MKDSSYSPAMNNRSLTLMIVAVLLPLFLISGCKKEGEFSDEFVVFFLDMVRR